MKSPGAKALTAEGAEFAENFFFFGLGRGARDVRVKGTSDSLCS